MPEARSTAYVPTPVNDQDVANKGYVDSRPNTETWSTSVYGNGITSTGAARFLGLNGVDSNATEADEQTLMMVAGTFQNAGVNVLSNASTTAVTQTLEDDGAATAIVITITALTTGLFTDTVNTATIAAQSLCAWQTLQSTVGNITVTNTTVEFVRS